MTISNMTGLKLAPKFAVFDIDGTIFRSGLYREVIFELVRQNSVPTNFSQSFTKLEQDWKARAHLNAYSLFEDALATAFDSALPQIKVVDFERAAATIIATQSQNVYAYTRHLIQKLRE